MIYNVAAMALKREHTSPADMCNLLYSNANNGKGAEFGTNEADIISIY